MAVFSEDSGLRGDVKISETNKIIIVAFTTIAWYNVAELTVLIQAFFKRRSGIYYYSLLTATWGICIHALGLFLKYFHLTDSSVGTTVATWGGWIMMVTGQSIVLYSRLHLVVHARWVRWVLVMILCNAAVFHTTIGVLTFLTNVSETPDRYVRPYSIVERVQVTAFFIQEVILSMIYIWKTTSMLRCEGALVSEHFSIRSRQGRKVLLHTVGVNIVIIALDMTLLGLQYSGLYDIQTTYKSAVYSVKLKLEFNILNQLIKLVQGNTVERVKLVQPGAKSLHENCQPYLASTEELERPQRAHLGMSTTHASPTSTIALRDL